MNNLRELIKTKRLYFDGGTGTVLQSMGLPAGTPPEKWNIDHPERITQLHKSYLDAGCNIIKSNTFGVNCNKYENYAELIEKALVCAKNAVSGRDCAFVAFDMGPTGRLLKPLGDLDFEEAVEIFGANVRVAAECGADLILIETMNDSYETKAAVLAAKENCDLPIFVTNVYDESGKLMTGATPSAMIAMLEGMGVDALGMNCSLGPDMMLGVLDEFIENASVPVIVNPNAGLPVVIDGKTSYNINEKQFAEYMREMAQKGACILGGCCGTTPEYMRLMVDATKDIEYKNPVFKTKTVISSYTHSVEIGKTPTLIGERINPTGKPRLKSALREKDMSYILNEALRQEEAGVHILDVNTGLPEIDEAEMLKEAVESIQAVTDVPLQLDSNDPKALEGAMRIYNGKPLVNSVNGKAESMESIFPLVKKYGGVVVALTLDEDGIPETAEGRVEIAKKILSEAKKYGIDKKDIIFDTLAMTISADNGAAKATLRALKTIKEELGCHTSLGVSNVSFGLPVRDAVNGVFFALALENGLSAAIMNPYSSDMMKTYYSFRALKGMDENCADYIKASSEFVQAIAPVHVAQKTKEEYKSELQSAIIKGFKEKSAEITFELLKTAEPLEIVQNEIIPALNIVGKGFEEKTVYLPQLLMSAESAKSAFEKIKSAMSQKSSENQGTVIIATVYGDIHDIGKNIVKLLLENYGFSVVDMGKDVPPEEIVKKAVELHAPLVGLSALMTTTVPAMEETIKQLNEHAPWCKTVVGGAVLTQEYADKIGADKYARDAMETVRFAEEVMK